MVKKVGTASETLDISLAQAIRALRPINNSLYNTSEHLEPLIALLLASISRADTERAVSSCNVLIDHLVATSAALKKIIEEVGTGLKPTEPKPPATH